MLLWFFLIRSSITSLTICFSSRNYLLLVSMLFWGRMDLKLIEESSLGFLCSKRFSLLWVSAQPCLRFLSSYIDCLKRSLSS